MLAWLLWRWCHAQEISSKHVNPPKEEAEKRDVKGLYAKARRGELPNFTGVGSPYESPEDAEIRLNSGEDSIEACVQQIVDYLGKV